MSINLTIILYYRLYDRSLVNDKDSFLASEESYHYFISRLYLLYKPICDSVCIWLSY